MIKPKVWWVIFTLFLFSCSDNNPGEPKLTIAVASNMQIAMEDIAERFTLETGIPVQVSSGSSGVLSAQIQQGAPFDLFLSANMAYPRALEKAGLTKGSPSTYAYGVLVLWAVDGTDISDGLQSLSAPSVSNFAIANPQTAPYGIAAMQALERSGLVSELKDKMVIGESIGQVNQYVSSETVQVGLTSSSVMHSKKLEKRGKTRLIDQTLYEPIEQGVVILNTGLANNPEPSKQFYDFMFSPNIQAVLTLHGYRALRDTK